MKGYCQLTEFVLYSYPPCTMFKLPGQGLPLETETFGRVSTVVYKEDNVYKITITLQKCTQKVNKTDN